MKTTLIVVALFLLSLGTFAQCASKLAGNYIVNGDTAGGTVTLTPAGSGCCDSGEIFNSAIFEMHGFMIDCGGHSLWLSPGGCTFVPSWSGNFSDDYNYIYITYIVTDINTNQVVFQTQVNLSRYPLLPDPKPQQQVAHDTVITIKPQTNPVSQILYFTINANDLPSFTNIRIIDLEGKCIYQSNVSIQTGVQAGIDVQNFAPGMYILEATNAKFTLYRLKFIKQ